MQDFKNLKVWQKSYRLALEIYRVSRTFPQAETYGLRSQLRRAALSISNNIAEGCGREGDGEFARFLGYAVGSSFEVENELLLAKDLEYIPTATHQELARSADEVRRMLVALHRRVQKTPYEKAKRK